MEDIIASGQADIVEIGRALLADPYLVKKALEGDDDDITPCLRCYECFGETSKSETVKCTVNPTMGQQLSEKNRKKDPRKVKRILIAGGGPAGMEAAIIAADRGHDVTLVEKSDKLGGNLHPAGAAYFKEDIRKLCRVLIKRIEKASVKVILNTEVTPEYVEKFNPDELFVAIGANELCSAYPGNGASSCRYGDRRRTSSGKIGKKGCYYGRWPLSEERLQYPSDMRERNARS